MFKLYEIVFRPQRSLFCCWYKLSVDFLRNYENVDKQTEAFLGIKKRMHKIKVLNLSTLRFCHKNLTHADRDLNCNPRSRDWHDQLGRVMSYDVTPRSDCICQRGSVDSKFRELEVVCR